MARREFLMRSHKYADKYLPTGFYLSEKLDGMRAVWIPWSVGQYAGFVPYCNTDKGGKDVRCSGLFSRYGKVIHCPETVTHELSQLFPDFCVDGELYAGRGGWNTVTSTCKRQGNQVDEQAWKSIKFHVFDIPRPEQLFSNGEIKNAHWKTKIVYEKIQQSIPRWRDLSPYFDFRLSLLRTATVSDFVQVVDFQQLPFAKDAAMSQVRETFDRIVSSGGEGVMLRHPSSDWEPKQSHFLLKYKADSDAEGTIIGYTAGTGKYKGMIGSIRLKLDTGVEFDLSGFTDQERTVPDFIDRNWCDNNEEGYTTRNLSNQFKIGTEITFTYRELSPDGKPKEARYLRPRLD